MKTQLEYLFFVDTIADQLEDFDTMFEASNISSNSFAKFHQIHVIPRDEVESGQWAGEVLSDDQQELDLNQVELNKY